MAANGEEQIEYESDPEEAKRSLAVRRREASDDEEGENDGYDERSRMNRRALIHSDEYYDEDVADEYYDEDDDEDDRLDEEEEGYDDDDGDYENEEVYRVKVDEGRVDAGGHAERSDVNKTVVGPEVKVSDGGGGRNIEEEGEKKEVEPFSVPTAGAFYMHDDRFRSRGGSGGRHRRGRGARKLWELRDERKWGHDKFEELNKPHRQFEERQRSSRGRYRGHGGKPRGSDHRLDRGYAKGNGTRPFDKIQDQALKGVVRGRGPKRYERVMKNSREAPTQHKRSWNPVEKTSHADSETAPAPSTKAESAPVPAEKQSSSLSYASPPFYPSGSTGNLTQKKGVQAGSISRNLPLSQGSASLRGKSIVDSVGLGKLSLNDGSSGSLGHLQTSSSGSSSIQLRAFQRGSVQRQVQPAFQTTNWHPVSGSDGSSAPTGKLESVSQQGKPKGAGLVSNGKGGLQENGRGSSFLFGGTRFMGTSGNVAVGHGEKNFPAFLPVMQFGSQHPGGMGFQPVGMAFPGYVGSPESGLASSEMTWLPVLAGAGAVGATYCPPYLAADGSYNAFPLGQPSLASSSSKENIANKSSVEWKPVQKPEVENKELVPRQSNPNRQPRRYSEMSFSK